MSPTAPQAGPMEVYRAKLAAGAFRADEQQALAVEMLQILNDRLARRAAADKEGGGLLDFLRFGRTREEPPRGLYLFGGVGRGKSALMDLFYAVAAEPVRRRVHFHAFMLEVHARLFELRKEPANRDRDDLIKDLARPIAKGARLLCFDEFDVTDVADAMILGRLFKKLWERGVVVVATSNRPPDELYRGGLNRDLFLPFIDELKSRLDVLAVDGPTDYRLLRMKGMPVYYAPLGRAAGERIARAFDVLTDGETPQATELMVQGRRLAVPVQAKGVARFAFAELCARALGAADYLELARSFHTLVLVDIPMLTPDKRNEAKRFVTLIDALYEHKVKLVASAEAQPDRLYPEGDGSFEFRRTVSRLIEMQSADYLALAHVTAA